MSPRGSRSPTGWFSGTARLLGLRRPRNVRGRDFGRMPDGSASLVPRKRFSGERHPPDGDIFPGGADHAVGARPRAHGDTLRGEIQTLVDPARSEVRSEEYTSELETLMRTSYAVFCLHKKR